VAAFRKASGAVMIPSFSIVVETENLETATQQQLLEALERLARQTISPQRAREVVLIDSGLMERSATETIRERFPWIVIHTAGEPIDYYAAKALGVALTTGEVLVFFDCDVQYESSWLESILEAMASDPNAEVVAGETSLAVSGPYTLAVLLTWAFPPWSQRDRPYSTTGYAANNVAFRRRRLAETPLPLQTGLRRGNCTLHAHRLVRAGARMLRAPQARALHPMLPFRQYYPRLWGAGYNEAGVMILELRSRGRSIAGARAYALLYVTARRCARLAIRSLAVGWRSPRWWAYMPAALPLAISGLVVSLCGTAAAVVSPALNRVQG
jgi:glycosyltransferase involved in cell wall biosynthesis